MARKKQDKFYKGGVKTKPPVKSTPLFLGAQALDFDDISAEELMELTDEQKTDRFASQWLLTIDPFMKYKKYFDASDKSGDRIIREVKIYHTRFVVQDGWSEKKYVMVIDHLLENGFPVLQDTIERSGALFESERLPFQMKEKKLQKRRRI